MLYFACDCLPRCLRSGVMPGGNYAINSVAFETMPPLRKSNNVVTDDRSEY